MFGVIQHKKRINDKKFLKKDFIHKNYSTWSNSKIFLAHSKNSIHFFDNDKLVLLFNGRIDNRNELYTYLNIEKKIFFTDEKLIDIAFQKWGKKIVNYVIGDWSFAIWDQKSEELFISKDHYGISSIYYFSNSEYFIFSSSIETMLQLNLHDFKPNIIKIQKMHLGINEHGKTTFYNDLFRLPPAHFITLNNNSLHIEKYWQLEHKTKIIYKNPNDYFSHFNEIFKEAINCRLSPDKNGSLLSGGLDSTSISALAAIILKEKNKKLYSFTSIPYYNFEKYIGKYQIGNESENINLLLKEYSNIVGTYTKSMNCNPIDSVMKMLKIHQEPVIAVNNHFWIADILSIANTRNIPSLLIGQGGNHTISWPPILDDTIPQPNNKLLNLALKSKIAMSRKLNINIKNSILNSSAEFDSVLKKEIIKSRLKFYHKSFSYKQSNEYRLKLIAPGASKGGALLYQLGNSFHVELRDPCRDKRILEFCLSIPLDIYTKNNKHRLLIRESMKGILPGKILENKTRGLQSADLPQRLINNKTSIIDNLNQLSNISLVNDTIDLVMLKEIALNIFNQKNEKYALLNSQTLLSGIMTGNFLKQFD